MADIDWNAVVSHVSELSSVSVSAQVDILTHVNTYLDPRAFDGEDGPTYRLIRIMLAAHLAHSLGVSGGVSGEVASKKVGPVSISYHSSSSQSLSGTTYGREYMRLIRNSPARLPFVTGV